MPDITPASSQTPATRPPRPRAIGTEIGKSGTRIYSGIITGEDYNTYLTGPSAIRQYEIMRRSDSTIRSTLQVVKLPIRSANWHVLPAADKDGVSSPEDENRAQFVERELMHRNVNWHDFLREALTCCDFGYSVFEKVFEATDMDGVPLIGLSKIAYRKQTTIYKWAMDDDAPGVTQRLPDGSTPLIPRAKLAVFTHDKEGDNYEGISLLRYVFKDWDIKDKLTLVNAIALEKIGVPVPYAKAKEGKTPTQDEWDEVEDVLRNFRANEEAFLRSSGNIEVEMMDLKGSSVKDVIPTLNYHDRRISQAILAQFMDLGGSSGSGSQSLAKDLTSLFMKSEEALANTLASVIQEEIIKQLCDLNFTDMGNGYPQISFGSISDDDPQVLATTYKTLVDAKMLTPDIEMEDFVRKVAKLPAMTQQNRAKYEQNQKLAEEAAKQLASGIDPNAPTDGKNPNVKPNNPAQKGDNLKPEAKTAKQAPATVKAAVEAARTSRQGLLDVLLG